VGSVVVFIFGNIVAIFLEKENPTKK